MISSILGTLLPVFFAIFLGYVLARKEFFNRSFLDVLNKFVYWISLPFLIIASLAGSEHLPKESIRSFFIFTVATIILIGLSYIYCRLKKVEIAMQGTFIQAAFRGNLAFIAIPIIIYALRDESQQQIDHMITQTVLIFAPTMVIYNIIAVLLLVRSSSSASISKSFKQIIQNPLIISSVIGLLLAIVPFKTPEMMLDSLQFIGKMAGPAALICVGGSMAYTHIGEHWTPSLIASVFKVALLPIITWLICLPFDLDNNSLMILLILSTSPTAVASYVMAKQMGGDENLASSTIVISTILSPLSMATILYFMDPRSLF